MGYWPEVLESEAEVRPLRRQRPRHTVRTLAYVKLDQGNGGIIRDLTESGMAVQAVARLRADQDVALSFDLMAPKVHIEARGRVAWADASGQAGIQFLDLTPRGRRTLCDWLLLQMFATAAASGRHSIFATEPDRELMFSAAARPAIVVGPEVPLFAEELELPRFAWGWFSVSVRSFSIFVDALVLLCAVMLFSIASIAAMGGVPVWPLAVTLFLTSATIFVAVYQMLFSTLLRGATPGRRLALLAAVQSHSGQDEEAQRFR